MRIFFDTNLLAYQFDDDQPLKQQKARERLLAHAAEAVISTHRPCPVSLTQPRNIPRRALNSVGKVAGTWAR